MRKLVYLYQIQCNTYTYVEGCIIKRLLVAWVQGHLGRRGCNLCGACLDSIVEQQTTNRGEKNKPNSYKSIETKEIKIKWIKLIELYCIEEAHNESHINSMWNKLVGCSSLPLNACDFFVWFRHGSSLVYRLECQWKLSSDLFWRKCGNAIDQSISIVRLWMRL